MAMLSLLEHSRSPRPSILLNCFLFLTILFDIAQTRSIWLSAQTYNDRIYASLFNLSTVWKAMLVLLESKHKRRWLGWDLRDHSPEETSGLYGLSTLFWLNPLLMSGYKKVLTMPDLFALDRAITTASLLQASLKLDTSHIKGRKYGLARALGRALAVPFIIPVASRLVLILFSICQALLIESLLDYLDQPADAPANTSYGLIGATIIIYYLGIPVSTALHGWSVQRSLFMARSCLCSAIYRKTTQVAPVADADDANALTLMSIDVEQIQIGLEAFHEFWAIPLQGAISSWLLYRQLGAAFASSLVLIVVCTGASVLLMGMVAPRQMAWMSKIEQRVWTTAGVIGNMKNIKISGLARPVQGAVQEMRVNELDMGNKFRRVLLAADTISYMPGLLAAMFTFAVTSYDLDVATIFTSVAYLSLLADPLMNLFQAAPELVAAFACLHRIQGFLEQRDRRDFRQIQDPTSVENEVDSTTDGSVAVRIVDGSFGWVEEKMVLRDISATIISGLTMVVGPVASGKSTLCRALLGEVPYARGRVIMASRFAKIGFCDQTPFLLNATVKENIAGFSDIDESRYAQVIEATMFGQDLSLLPRGDQTRIGSNGISLSGGQKQRVSIARALYQQCDMFVFDDVLSGLDAETEQHVFARIFGPQGLLKQRNTPAVLCTHAVRHLRWADHIIALTADGLLAEQGTFNELITNEKYVHNLGVHSDSQHEEPAESASTEVPPASNDYTVKATAESASQVEPATKSSRALGDAALFSHYFRSVGVFCLMAFSLLGITCGFLFNFSTVWLRDWSSDVSSATPERSTSFYIGIYSLLQCLALASVVGVNGIAMLSIIKLSGSRLHEAAIRTVIAAPLRFFATTDIGVVTNLFSQDMNVLDNELPLALANTNVMVWLAVGAAAVAATSSTYILISYPFIGAAVFAVQKFYLRTSRQLRLLDLEMKSPL
jgi:ABC-type multidrug transport system fused ATPase/permease subunit